jgi:hypothetical protein
MSAPRTLISDLADQVIPVYVRKGGGAFILNHGWNPELQEDSLVICENPLQLWENLITISKSAQKLQLPSAPREVKPNQAPLNSLTLEDLL